MTILRYLELRGNRSGLRCLEGMTYWNRSRLCSFSFSKGEESLIYLLDEAAFGSHHYHKGYLLFGMDHYHYIYFL